MAMAFFGDLSQTGPRFLSCPLKGTSSRDRFNGNTTGHTGQLFCFFLGGGHSVALT